LPRVFIFLSSQVVTISVFEDIANLHIIAVCTNTRGTRCTFRVTWPVLFANCTTWPKTAIITPVERKISENFGLGGRFLHSFRDVENRNTRFSNRVNLVFEKSSSRLTQ